MKLDQTLVEIRERGFLELLDLALRVVAERPRPIALAALLGIVPFEALNAAVLGWTGLPVWWPLLVALEAPFATAPLTVVLGGMLFGEPLPLGRQLTNLARGLGRMLVFQGLLRGMCIVIVPLIPVVPARMCFLNEVILLEESRWSRVWKRSQALVADRGGEFFGRWLAALAYSSAFVLAFWWASDKVAEVMVKEWTWDQPDWQGFADYRVHFAAWVSIAFFGVVRFLSYVDQRIRLEGWEVELRLRAVAATFAEDDES